MNNNKYGFLKGTGGVFWLALFFSTVYNLMLTGPAFFVKVLVDAGNIKDMEKIKKVFVVAVIYMIVFIIFGLIRSVTLRKYKYKAMRNYKRDYIERILAMKYNDFNKNDNGKYLSNLTNNATLISDGYVEGRINIVRALTRAGLIIGVMLYMNWKLFLISLVCLLVPVVLGVFANKQIVKITSRVSEKNAHVVTSIKELLAGFGIIKSFKAEKEVSNSIGNSIDSLERSNAKLRQFEVLTFVFSDTPMLFMMIIIFVIGTFDVMNNKMTIGALMAFVELLITLQGPMEVIPGFFAKFNSAKKLIDEDFIEIESDSETSNSLAKLTSGINISNLNFSYDGTNEVLHNIDMKLESKKMYAIVGSSGSGKSTVAKLISGNYFNYEGNILFDESELKDIDNIYDILSIIDQNVFIFDDTIYNNISMFKDFSEEDMNKAIELSGLSELIKNKGGDYKCGENGSNLSGGEKQRISIARALISEKQIIIMDESTSSLDIKTAREIENTIYNLNDSLRIIITHNLNDTFLKKCSGIFVFKNGKIVENGTFDELIDRKQFFNNMYELWK